MTAARLTERIPRHYLLAAGAALLAVLLVLVGALLGGWRPFSAQPDVLTFGPGGDLEQFVLFEGQCARGELAGGGSFGSSSDAQCGTPHDVEVVATTTPVDETRPVAYPGEAAMADFGRSYCALFVDSQQLQAVSGGVERSDLRMTAIVPSEAAFLTPRTSDASTTGARQISCVVSRKDGGELTDRFSVI